MQKSSFFTILEEMAARSQLGEFELIVLLALLRAGENAYGVPIAAVIEEITGREAGIGSVYAALERLQQKGMVSSSLGDPTPERGGRAKRYFRVTKAGLQQVRKTRKALVALWRGLPQLEGGKA
ncbi:MAG TPA: helix-turn-helix transcriptional regulator [Terriglobia bacterium]|nr:helix-turn-helix transcriptional regulator [Terriglobia bacterium]